MSSRDPAEEGATGAAPGAGTSESVGGAAAARVAGDDGERVRIPWRRLAPYFLTYCGCYGRFGTVFPFLFLHMNACGLTPAEVSLVYLARAVPSMFVSQIWGYIADEILTRRLVLLILFPLATVIYAAFFLLPAGAFGFAPLPTFVVLGFLLGTFNSPIAQMVNGLLFGDESAQRHFPVLRASGSFAFIVINLALGFLLRYTGLPMGSSAVAFAVLSAVGFSAVWRVRTPQVRPAPSERLSFRRVQAILFGNPRIAGILLFVILYETGFALGMYVLQPFMIQDELGAGTDVQAVCASIGALAEIPFFLLGDYFIRRIGAFRCLFIACVFNVLRWLGVFFATDPWHIVALSTLHSFTFGMFYFGVVRYINSHADLRLKASSQTLLGIVYYGVSTTLSTFTGTWLLEEMMLSVRDCYLIVAVMASITLVYLSMFWWTEKRWAPAKLAGGP